MTCKKQDLYDVMWERLECGSRDVRHQHIHITYEYAPRQVEMDFKQDMNNLNSTVHCLPHDTQHKPDFTFYTSMAYIMTVSINVNAEIINNVQLTFTIS
jgi:hypothetical protein